MIVFLILLTNNDFSNGTNHRNQYNFKEALHVNVAAPLPPLTLENVKTELDNLGVLCPDEVFAQIKIESAYLSSFLTRTTNNMLGMRYPFKRKTTAAGLYLPETKSIIYGTQKELAQYRTKQTYAVYNTWQDAVADYKLWQDQNFDLSERYLAFLNNLYAEDPDYIAKIRQVRSRAK